MRQKTRKGIQAFMLLFFPLLFLFFSPYLIISGASEGIINGSAMIFITLLVLSVVSSRLFCGWLCPAGALQEIMGATFGKSWNSKWRNLSKYMIWIFWLGIILALYATHRPLKADFFYNTEIGIGTVITYFLVVILIYSFTLATGKRGMCHSLCWIAPFMVTGEKIADGLHISRFRIKGESEKCIGCGQCTKKCPMSLPVQEMVQSGRTEHTECITCLECIDACPKNAIYAGLIGRFEIRQGDIQI